MLHLPRVIEHVVADRLGIGPERGHVIDVTGCPPRGTGSKRVAAVGFEGTEPEAPAGPGRHRIQERLEVAGVIAGADTGHGARRSERVEGPAGHPAGIAVRILRHAGSPPLLRVADEPSPGLQYLRPRSVLRREVTDVIRRGTELPWIPSGQQRGTRW